MFEEYNIFDVNGVKFRQFDVLKVYHYTGARRKKCYMYKQVLGVSEYNPLLIDISHLDGDITSKGYYTIRQTGLTLIEYEIIQSAKADIDERKSVAKKLTKGK